jgi:transposase-like protein
MALSNKQQPKKRNEYSDATKAAAMAALLMGQGVDKVAEQYNIPVTTLYSWKSKQKNGDGIVNLASQKKEKIGDLLLEYLNASLTTLRVQVEFFKDEEWLRLQDASSVATLHGVTTDKAIRLLEALSKAPEPEDEEDEESE